MREIVYNKWNKMGRFGNQLWQLSSLYGMADRYNREPILPAPWLYQEYFEHHPKIKPLKNPPVEVGEPNFSFTGWDYWDEKEEQAGDIFGIGGWLQSSKYFSKEITNKLLKLKDEFKDKMWAKWEHVFRKPVIMIGFRVGEDYVDNGNYEILPILYQISALYKYFPDWRENYNILVCSDDMQYARLNMDCAENIYFAEGIDVEQMYLGTLCTHFILPNSTFSYFQAYLGEKENSRVVYPSKYFKSYLASNHSTDTFWEKDWISHDYRGEKIALKDVCFTIPVKYDHPDRQSNLILIYRWFNENFDTNICLGEQGKAKLVFIAGWTSYMEFPEGRFHRTKMLNDMALSREEPIIVNFDCDNICPILQLILGVDTIRKGEADMVYPYDGRAARVKRNDWYDKLFNTNGDCGVFGGKIFPGTREIDPISVGHIVIWNKEKFFEGGGENEHFISYGPEDIERYERFNKLGYRTKRIKGIVYHIDHWCGPDSSGSNPQFGLNYKNLERIKKMTKEQLLEEIKTWEWMK